MSFQIDYIPVSDGRCCGDAIAIRWSTGNPGEQKIAIIDGGNLEAGERLVELITLTYGATKVDYVFSTHLDADHIAGLKVILEKLEVGTLYMHLPWEHAAETSDLYKKDVSVSRLETTLQKSLDQVAEVEEIAIEKGVPVEEVFAGEMVGDNILVLGPSKSYYEMLTSQFRDTPEAKSAIQQALDTLIKMGEKVEEKLPTKIRDFLHVDILGNNGETSAENNSSLILLFFMDGQKVLFCGDAGIPALTAAADYADIMAIPLTDLRFFHIPHHGSKNNLGSDLLKRIKAGSAIASASEKCSHKHPSKRVTNALHKNGTTAVNKTWGQHLMHDYNAPRPNWSPVPNEPFYEEFEED